MNMVLGKDFLNTATTVLGATAGIAQIAGNTGVVDTHTAGFISGLSVFLLGYLTHKPATPPQQ